MKIGLGSEIRWATAPTAAVGGIGVKPDINAAGIVVGLSGRRVTVRLNGTDELQSMLLGEWIEVVAGAPEPCDPKEMLAFDGVSDAALLKAQTIRGHVNELETGFWERAPSDDRPWEPRPEYDPSLPIGDRERAKAYEFATSNDSLLRGRRLSTIRLWRKKLADDGLVGLIDRRQLRGPLTVRDADPALIAIIQAEVDRAIYEPTRSFKYFFRRVSTAAHEEGIDVPSAATVRRIQEQLARGFDLFGSAKARVSKAASTGGAIEKKEACYPGEFVEIDSTILDVNVLKSDGEIARPEITLALDRYTDAPLTWRIVEYGALKGTDAAAMIAECVAPRRLHPHWRESEIFAYNSLPDLASVPTAKATDSASQKENPVVCAENIEVVTRPDEDAVAARQDKDDGEAPDPPGDPAQRTVSYRQVSMFDELDDRIPEVPIEALVIDNGGAFLAAEVTEACRAQGVSIYQSRFRTGADKGTVERAFETLNQALWQYVPGYVGRSVDTRGSTEPPARKRARGDDTETLHFTCAELEVVLSEFFSDVWMQTPIAGNRIPGADNLDVSPREKFDYYTATYGQLRVPKSANEYFSILPTEYRTIQAEGIELFGKKYNSTVLNGLRRQDAGLPGSRRRDRHPVKFHRGDVSVVFWLDPRNQTWTPIPWVHRNEFKGPFADKTWRYARRLATGRNAQATEREIGQTLHEFLKRVENGPNVSAREKRLVAENEMATKRAAENRPRIDAEKKSKTTRPKRASRPKIGRLTGDTDAD